MAQTLSGRTKKFMLVKGPYALLRETVQRVFWRLISENLNDAPRSGWSITKGEKSMNLLQKTGELL